MAATNAPRGGRGGRGGGRGGFSGPRASREELLHNVWRGVTGNERMVDVYVFWLRTKIERDPANPVHLITVRGSGYLFDPPSADQSVNEPPTRR